MIFEHPDVSRALRSGYASFQHEENADTPENRADYIEEHSTELIKWLTIGHPEVLEEFIEFSGQACRTSYWNWLN
jgi:hypothetical protein